MSYTVRMPMVFTTVVFGAENGIALPSGVGVALLALILLISFSLIIFLLIAITRHRARGRATRIKPKSSSLVDPWREAGRRIQSEETDPDEIDRG